MADAPDIPPPTEADQLKVRIAQLEAELRQRNIEEGDAKWAAKKPKPRQLDKNATSAFLRPYDGR